MVLLGLQKLEIRVSIPQSFLIYFVIHKNCKVQTFENKSNSRCSKSNLNIRIVLYLSLGN